jgi:hypothetical protein
MRRTRAQGGYPRVIGGVITALLTLALLLPNEDARTNSGAKSLPMSSYVATSATTLPRVGLVCNDSLAKPVIRGAPWKCTILPPRAAFAEGANLIGLRWRTWGGSSATGTGFERGFHLPLTRTSVAVVVYRIVSCKSGVRLYTRLRVSSSYGTSNVRAQGCLT